MTATKTAQAPDAAKVFTAIAAIISRREGQQVRLVGVQKVNADVQRKAG